MTHVNCIITANVRSRIKSKTRNAGAAEPFIRWEEITRVVNCKRAAAHLYIICTYIHVCEQERARFKYVASPAGVTHKVRAGVPDEVLYTFLPV